MIDSLPEPLRNICPISVSSSSLCTVPGCKLPKVCEEFNDESVGGEGCKKGEGCDKVHVHRTCEQDVNGAELGCRVWIDVRNARRNMGTQALGHGSGGSGSGSGSGDREMERKVLHVSKRVHRENSSEEENRARLLLWQLCEVHRLGKWVG